MKYKISVFILLTALLISCNRQKDQKTTPKSEAQQIIDAAINFHGMAPLDNASLSFLFRDMFYTYKKSNGIYQYTRTQIDSTGSTVYDIMNNDGLVRLINKNINEIVTEPAPIEGDTATITEEKRAAYTRSVNSVIYFFLLPYGLNDPAVNKELIGETTIEGKTYYEVKITFEQEGGGEDFDDVFLYWFDKSDYSMDYFAYLYHTDGGGIRFRKAINTRKVNDVLIQDYVNYKPKDEKEDIMNINELYEAGQLEVLSEIINEKVKINY